MVCKQLEGYLPGLEFILFLAEHRVLALGAYGAEMHPVPRRTKAREEAPPKAGQLQGDSIMSALLALGDSEVAEERRV